MFCSKCGTKALDDALFCQKCGAKLIVDTPFAHTEPETPASSTVHRMPEINNVSAYKSGSVPVNEQPKKKSRKLLVIIGVAALVVLSVIFIAINWEGGVDYKASVRAHTPFADSQGLPYTYGEVLDKYMPDAKWDISESGDEALVNIWGNAKGTDEKISITINAAPYEPDPNLLLISTRSVTVNGNKLSTQDEAVQYILAMFIAYDDGADDFSNYTGQQNADKPETVISSKATEGLCYKGISVEQMLGKSQADIISIFGEPEPSEFGDEFVYGDVNMRFDTWTLPEPFFMGMYGGPLEDYTYNGQPFTDDTQEIIEIMGREPDFYSNSSITYYWDYLDATVDLTFIFVVDEYFNPYVDINISWWHPFGPVEGPGDDYYDYDYPYEDDTYSNLPALPDGFKWVEGPSVVTEYYDLYDFSGFKKITGVVKNTSGVTKDFVSISFNLYDSNGYQIGSASDSISNLGAESSWRFEAFILDNNTSSYKFVELFGW